MKKLLLIITALLMSLAPVTDVYAQSGDSKYAEGMTQYKKGNMQTAIRLFNESKILDPSAANKKRCNTMIARCRKPKTSKKKQEAARVELSLNRNHLEFEGKTTGANVITVTSEDGWTAALEDEKDATWCILEPTEDMKSLIVKTEPSHLTVPREAKIKITDAEDDKVEKTVTVRQGGGKSPLLYAEPEEVDKIDADGEEMVVKMDCVSDTLYSDGKKWRVKSSPDWVVFMPDKQKEATGLRKVFKSKKDKDKREPLEPNELSVRVAPNKAKGERTGYIVVESQSTEVHIKLKQKGSK